MPSGQLMTMPVLIVNMGGEMVYILEQRLQAQKIPDTKGQKVLNDVVRTMYYPRFVDELFKPQEMYSIQSTRQIFDRLAHSSIMRLNESSMDKLFDLMAMGFKYQIISCPAPQEMIDITSNHLDVLKRLVGSTPQVAELLDECVRQMQVAYGAMSLWDFNAMRQSLCTFFQDRKVKVSLFLHDQTQNSDGSIVVPSSGTLPIGAFTPGTVRYFAGGAVVGGEALTVAQTAAWAPGTGVRTALGSNVYEKDRAPAGHDAGKPLPAATPPPAAAAAAPPPAPAAPSDTVKTKAAVGELNMLAELIGAQPATETFKLENLFGADIFAKPDGKGPTAEIIQIDGAAPSEHRRDLDSIRQQMEGIGGGAPSAAPDDLLDLMDKA
mmetsp:Transcript_55144/g.124150  ORF Transcript_55144/g.124150 Transcript_55144/m.124150 type:complete len:379 (-) Transcript_55144:93-1229(-)